MASKLGRLQTEIHYCYHCFEWVVGEEWEKHCQSHIQAMKSKKCGTIIYCYTLIRPGYCPCCLGNKGLPASQRLQSWIRDRKLWDHVNNHLERRHWPSPCPHPLCDVLYETALKFHFMDDHGFSRTHSGHARYRNLQQSRNQEPSAGPPHEKTNPDCKRKSFGEDNILQWIPIECSQATSIPPECSSPMRQFKRVRQTEDPTRLQE
jgi:hypothetical protein